MKQLLEDARRLIRISSVTQSGNEELANLVHSLLQRRGLKTHLQHVLHSVEDLSKRQFNVIGILGDSLVDKKTRKGLLLSSHLDTCTPGLVENWTETAGDPYNAVIKDGRLYGLGAADAKLDLLCKLKAIEKFREKKLRQPIYLVGTCGEEMGMFGARYLIKSMALNPKCVVIGAPTDLRVVHCQKSWMVCKVSIGFQLMERDARGFNRRIDLHSFGRMAHASSPDQGTNAILQASDFLKTTSDNGFELRFTKFEGGDATNKVPDRALAEFYLTSHQFEDFKRFFRETVKKQSKERAFRVELGGLGDMGVRFLPDTIFGAISEVITYFKSLSASLRAHENEFFNPSHSTVSLGQVRQRQGGMDLLFDLRLLPESSTDEVIKKVTEGVQSLAAKFPSLNISIHIERVNPGLDTSPEDPFLTLCGEALEAAGIDPMVDKASIATEAAQYAQAGYPALIFGPGSAVGNSHSPNEHVLLDQLEKATHFYEKLIERVCL